VEKFIVRSVHEFVGLRAETLEGWIGISLHTVEIVEHVEDDSVTPYSFLI